MPNPITLAMTMATSQDTSRADASVSKTHWVGGSFPSEGIDPSEVNQRIAEPFNSSLKD